MNSQKFHPHFFARLPEEFGGKIPFIVTDLVTRLRELDAVKTVGLFRLSGSASELNTITSLLDEGRIKDWSKFTSINTIANVLKKYFRDKVETDPFFPVSCNDKLIEASKIEDTQKQLEAFKDIIDQLPRARKLTLAYIVNYFIEIESHQSENKMNFNNLAIVFAPNLFCNDNPTLMNGMFLAMLKGANFLFGDIVLDEKVIITDDDMKIIMAPPVNIAHVLELRTLRKNSLLSFVPGELVKSN